MCPRKVVYLVCIAGVQWRFFFRVCVPPGSPPVPQWPFLDSPQCTIQFEDLFVQRILEPTWKSFLSLVRMRCSISSPPVPKRSSTKRLMIPATDFPVAELPAMGSSIFSKHPFFDRSRDSVTTLPVPWDCAMIFCLQGSQARSRDCIENITQQHRSARVGTMP